MVLNFIEDWIKNIFALNLKKTRFNSPAKQTKYKILMKPSNWHHANCNSTKSNDHKPLPEQNNKTRSIDDKTTDEQKNQ